MHTEKERNQDNFIPAVLGQSSTLHCVLCEMIQRSANLSHLLERCGLIDNVMIENASTFRLDIIAGSAWIAVGDASYTFDPLAGNGILKALESGIDSSQAILANSHSDWNNSFANFAESALKTFEDYLLQRCRYYQREKRWPESSFWCRRQQLQTISTK